MADKDNNSPDKLISPKRFIDRKDWQDIVRSSGKFYRRGHELVPNWMVTVFFITQILFITLMIYFSTMVILSMQDKSEVLNVIQYMLIVFVIVTAYSLYIVKKLKLSLTATEFMSLFLSKSLESYSSCFALVNKQGKVIYFNENFAKEYMSSDEVETKPYNQVLNRNFFNEKYMEKVKESLETGKENSFSIVSSTNNSQTMRNVKIIPLPRPEGIFVLKVITVKIIKGARPDGQTA